MIGIFLTTVNVRAGPSTSTDKVAQYQSGDQVRFDSIVEKIMVGEYDENGNFNSKVIRFVLKMKRDIVFDLSSLNILDKNVSLSNNKRSESIWRSWNRK